MKMQVNFKGLENQELRRLARFRRLHGMAVLDKTAYCYISGIMRDASLLTKSPK